MKSFRFVSLALALLLGYAMLPANAARLSAADGETEKAWIKGEALLTDASQITSNNSQSGFPPSNLLRPESEGFGTNEIIWHSAWSNPAPPPAGTDTYLQVHFNKAEQHVIFSMIGSMWQQTFDTPTEMIIQAANLPDGKWTEITHLYNMEQDFTSFSPDRYTSPHIDLQGEYTDMRFVVKKTMNAGNSSRYDSNGNPFVSLGRFQVYRAIEGEEEPVDPKANINLVFIGNSITAGATLSNASTQAPPIIARSLVQQATGITTNVFNGGHSGITTYGFLPGRDDFTKVTNAAGAFVRNNGGLLIFSIMLGTNDSACTTTEGAPVSPQTYMENLKKIIDGLIEKCPTCKIILNYPIWYSPNTHNGAKYLQEGLDRLRSYYPYIDEVIASYDQVYAGNRNAWEYFEDNKVLFTAENGNSGTFYLHPNALGAQRLAEVWTNSILDVLKNEGVEIPNPPTPWKLFQPSNNKKYTISTSRGDYGTKDGVVTNTVKTGINATKGEFAFITYNDGMYIYSVADKKFLYRDPVTDSNGWSNILLSNSFIEPFKVQYTGANASYPYCLTSLGYIANVASSTQKGVVLNSWSNCDGGNQVAIAEAGDFDPSEALSILKEFFSNQLEVKYRIVDSEGNLLDELTAIGLAGDVITTVPDNVPRKAYTTYTVNEAVTLVKGTDNVVSVTATWELPFDTSNDITNAHWYNLALREGSDYVTVDNGYKCNVSPTKEDVLLDSYQWAFQGDPFRGIVVYNRTDVSKTLSKVDDVAILANGEYHWQITESDKGFLLSNNKDGKYINEYGGAGGALGFWHNVSDVGSIFTVSEVGSLTIENFKLSTGATIKLFKSSPQKANQRAILVIPGGGYEYVAGSYEGSDWAPMLNELGYTVAVLTYTTPPTAPDGPLNEGREAMRLMREHGEEWNVATGQIGVMGFSAGGHLASTIATHTTGEEIPAFQILFYPVISMESTYTHAGSRQNLLGPNPSSDLVKLYSNEKQVTAQTPMAYICYASNDATVLPRNSTMYSAALRKAGVSVHSRSFPTGGHGFGFNPSYEYHNQLVADLTAWLQGIDSILTSIKTPKALKPKSDACYDLSGRRLANGKLEKGIYIAHGRKLLTR